MLGDKYTRIDFENIVSFSDYRSSLYPDESPQNIGLSHEDYSEACINPNTLFVGRGNKRVPILIPTSGLYWYNKQFLQEKYEGAEVYVYVGNTVGREELGVMHDLLNSGGVILLHKQESQSNPEESAVRSSYDILREVRSEKLGAFLNQYIGYVEFEGADDDFTRGPTYVDVFTRAVESGFINKVQNGNVVSIESEIDDNQIDRLWCIYKSPFEDISASSPISAGYDKQGFYRAMKDPSVIKAVNRKDGVITTLALFETCLGNAGWLNPEYFAKKYAPALDTGNLLLFTGIVSDENMRGSAYSADVINVLLKVADMRKQNQVITFECNEVSSEYLPEIVSSTINSSGFSRVNGLEKEVSRIVFEVLRKDNAGEK